MLSTRIPKHDKCLAVTLGHAGVDTVGQNLRLGHSGVKEIKDIGLEGVKLANLIDALPYDEQARCHNPPYGLVFLLGDQVVWWLSVCWGCNNVACGKGLEYKKTFDGKSPAAVHLLNHFNKLFDANINSADA